MKITRPRTRLPRNGKRSAVVKDVCSLPLDQEGDIAPVRVDDVDLGAELLPNHSNSVDVGSLGQCVDVGFHVDYVADILDVLGLRHEGVEALVDNM